MLRHMDAALCVVFAVLILWLATGCSEPPASPQPTWAPVTATPSPTPTPDSKLPAPVLALMSEQFVPTATPEPIDHSRHGLDLRLPTPTLDTHLAASAHYYGTAWQLDEATMRDVLTAAGWPVDLHDWALAITWRESRWSPMAANWGDQADGLGSTGLFQLWSGWYRFAGEDYTDWADPVVNARTAWAVYQYDVARGQPGYQWRTE